MAVWQMIPARAAPEQPQGWLAWVRRELFGG